MLGEAGATVYVTGRSVRGRGATPGRPETIEETAELVQAWGGIGIPIRVDHSDPAAVRRLFRRVRWEQKGRLDVLVNDIWGGDALTEWGPPPWELSLADGLRMLAQGIHTHIITSHYGVPLMVKRRRGLLVEVTDGVHLRYRGNLFYDLVKTSVIRLAFAYAEEFRDQKLSRMAAVALTPGFLRSEAVLSSLGVTEENWRKGIPKDPHFVESETPYYVGRAVAALAADPDVTQKSGKALSSGALAREYRFTDIDDRQPDFERYFERLRRRTD